MSTVMTGETLFTLKAMHSNHDTQGMVISVTDISAL